MQKLFALSFTFILTLFQFSQSAFANDTGILILGDSLSAAHNIALDKSWPVLFRDKIRAKIPDASVINASISGETTFGGVQRITTLLNQHKPSHLIIELGGNDGLRGLDFEQTRNNLDTMVKSALERNITVLLIGVRMPPNLGAAYNRYFQSLFESVVESHGIHYLPRFLEGVAASSPELMQSDGIHPTEIAQPILANRVFSAMEPLL